MIEARNNVPGLGGGGMHDGIGTKEISVNDRE